MTTSNSISFLLFTKNGSSQYPLVTIFRPVINVETVSTTSSTFSEFLRPYPTTHGFRVEKPRGRYVCNECYTERIIYCCFFYFSSLILNSAVKNSGEFVSAVSRPRTSVSCFSRPWLALSSSDSSFFFVCSSSISFLSGVTSS